MIRDMSGVPMIRGSHAFMDVMRQEHAVGRFGVSWEPMDQGLLTVVSMVRDMPHGSS